MAEALHLRGPHPGGPLPKPRPERRTTLLALFLLAGIPLSAPHGPWAEGERWAVIVGVGTYPALDGADLPGAARDARAVRDALVDRWGYPPEQVRLLLDGAATRAAVEEALTDWLGSRVAPGDHVLVYFAGAGSRIPDRDGDEADGLDETLVAADASPGSPEGHLSDDAFALWMDQLPSTEVVVILDHGTASHAGAGALPGPRAGPGPEAVPGARGRTLPPVPGEAPAAGGSGRAGASGGDGFDAGGALVLSLHAAGPGEEAVELDFGEPGAGGFVGGAFTTHLLRALWRSGPRASHADVLRETVRTLRRDGLGQTPRLAAAGVAPARPLVAGRRTSEEGAGPALPVRSLEGDQGELAAGTRLGLLPGSVLATSDGRHLVLETVHADASRGRWIGDAPGEGAGDPSAARGDTVRLVGRPFPPALLRVGVVHRGDTLVDLASGPLSGLPGVEAVVGEGAAADLHLRRDDDGTLRVLGPDGHPRPAVRAAEETGAVEDLLRGETARRILAAMDHPAPPFPVELRLEGDRAHFVPGEQVAFHVTSGRAGFLTLVDVGSDGTVSVLLPAAGAPAVPVEPGQTVTFPGEEMGFALNALLPAGREMVAAFVTSEPLALPPGDGYLEGDERLAQELSRALAAAAGSVEGAVRLDSWSSTVRTYEIRN